MINKMIKELLQKNIHINVVFVFIIVSIISIIIQHSQVSDLTIVNEVEEKEFYIIDNNIKAKSAIIYDVNSKSIVAGKNPYELKSIASITKLASAFVAFPYISDEDITTISDSDFDIDGYTALSRGEGWKTIDLIKYSLITSSNRGINAVGRTLEEKTGTPILEFMTNFFRDNGLVQTHFVNSTGLDAHTDLAGSESSALDLARFASIIIETKPNIAKITTSVEEDFFAIEGSRYHAKNTNILLKDISEEVLLSKTGYTDIAGGTLIMAVKKNESPVVFVVLGSTKSGRFTDMQTLLNLYDEYQRIGVSN